ncbi:MAG TPA: M48 family metallopeptidase [Candidatus Binatia bacterium]|jgi:STE24 endopeptidase|nr:M48 family metallopeptidase [Candidatus Binatia bacterium]
MSLFVQIVLALFIAKWAVELWLERLNRRNVLAHAQALPEAFRSIVDEPTYAKSVRYTLAKGCLQQFELTYDTAVLLVVLFSGVLPWSFHLFAQRLGQSAWAMAGFLLAIGVALALISLPLEWYAQFRLEERFDFNTTTQKLWWSDRLKGLLLALVLGYPLLALVLKLVEWTGHWWWLWAWGVLLAFQLIMAVLAPVLILPLFNKFTPLPEGGLRHRLLSLAERTDFRARSIQVMDGSKRSRHSNAFFTGFGGFRKIVLFDTLIQQLAEPELEAVLAHEIGHFKKKHIPKMLAASTLASLAGFYLLSLLAGQPWFYRSFGFEPGIIVPALLLFGLLSGVATFWFSPLAHWWSRRYEYQADAFAAGVMKETRSLIGALRKLNEKNLSNLTPHPLYSGFYYSHPTLLEREEALGAGGRFEGQGMGEALTSAGFRPD